MAGREPCRKSAQHGGMGIDIVSCDCHEIVVWEGKKCIRPTIMIETVAQLPRKLHEIGGHCAQKIRVLERLDWVVEI